MKRTNLVLALVAALLLTAAGACHKSDKGAPAAEVVTEAAEAFASNDFGRAIGLCERLLANPSDRAYPSQMCDLALDALKYSDRSGNDAAVPLALRLLDAAITDNIDSVADYMCALPVEDFAKIRVLLDLSHNINLPEDFADPDEDEYPGDEPETDDGN